MSADVKQQVDVLVSRTRCTGPLSEKEIARGAYLCWSNAVSLLGEARLLAAHSCLARAFSLTILALEELAKPPLLWQMAPSDAPEKWRSFWKDRFSKHSPKQEIIGRYGKFLEATGHGILEHSLDQSITNALDRLKQWGFYVDCADGVFQSPDELFAPLPEILDLVFAVAEERADAFAKFHASLEQSSWLYEHRNAPLVPGLLWPPPLGSEAEACGQLLSLASQYSRSQPPDYYAFGDALEQLAEVIDPSLLMSALRAVGRQCYDRTRCSRLGTAAARAFLMMRLVLHELPEDEIRTTLEEWKSSEGV